MSGIFEHVLLTKFVAHDKGGNVSRFFGTCKNNASHEVVHSSCKYRQALTCTPAQVLYIQDS